MREAPPRDSGLTPVTARPASVAGLLDPLLIIAALIGAYSALRATSLTHTQLAVVLSLTSTTIACLLELWRAPWHATDRPLQPAATMWRGALTTFIGTLIGLAGVLLCWWALSDYRRPYYQPLFSVLPAALPVAVLVIAAFVVFAEWRLGPDDSGARQIGLFALRQPVAMNLAHVRDDLLDMALKAFFLPINFCELSHALGRIRGVEHRIFELSWPQGHALIMSMLYALIIGAIMPGYLFSCRVFGNHVRKVDATASAWVVTLCCYAPFVGAFFGSWFDYMERPPGPSWKKPWTVICADAPVVLAVVGAAILLAEAWHLWSEAHFGIRSSNLSHRGLITNGPYRFSKHPVYVSKCVGWALIWMPFLAGASALECLRLTLLFACVCGIYLGRAWVEERLLSSDPDYVAYALWMDQHGMFSRLGKWFPSLTFASRCARWQGEARISPTVPEPPLAL